jgi:hypothetical protein
MFAGGVALEAKLDDFLSFSFSLLFFFLLSSGISITVWYLGSSAGPTCLYLSWASSSESSLAPPPQTLIGRYVFAMLSKFLEFLVKQI